MGFWKSIGHSLVLLVVFLAFLAQDVECKPCNLCNMEFNACYTFAKTVKQSEDCITARKECKKTCIKPTITTKRRWNALKMAAATNKLDRRYSKNNWNA